MSTDVADVSWSRSPTWRAVLLALLATCALACSTFRPVDPAAESIDLGEREGLVVFHVETNALLRSIHTSAGRIAKDLPAGTHLWVVAAPAGTYTLDSFTIDDVYWLLSQDDGRSRFHVRAGQLNYPGLLLIDREGGPNFAQVQYARIRLANRTAMLLEELEKRHPELLARYPLRYTGPGRDDFAESLATLRNDRPPAPAPTPAAGATPP